MGKGSSRNERKSNSERVEQAKTRENEARRIIEQLKKLPLRERSADHKDKLRRQKGILKEAIDAAKKSETHSLKGKGGRR